VSTDVLTVEYSPVGDLEMWVFFCVVFNHVHNAYLKSLPRLGRCRYILFYSNEYANT